jgi:PAS domain S-box-containing protein
MDPVLFRALIDRLNDAVEIIDAKTGRFIDVNERTCADLGYTREEMLKLSVTDIETELPTDFHWDRQVERLRTGGSMFFQGFHKRKDGSTFPVEVSVTYVEAPSQGYVLAVSRNVTERKRMEAELKQAILVAEAANRAKSEFLATMSHELRTPLTLILAPLGSLLRKSQGDSVSAPRADLERMQRNTMRLKEMVDDVLDYSKTESGRMGLDLEAVDIEEAMHRLIDDIRPAAAARGVALTLTDTSEGFRLVAIDRNKFEKIVLNLVSNAIKFTPSGGKVDVTVERKREELTLRVADTGIGIAPDKIPLLFQRFQQVDASSTRRYGGTGLGLALVKEFATLMAGDVSVESALGSGSTFSVTLPRRAIDAGSCDAALKKHEDAARVRAPGPSAPPPADATPPWVLGLPKVVLAEDTPDMRAYVAAELCAEFNVIAVENGKQALDAIRLHRPDAVLSDVMMPEMDGVELARAMKADPDLKLIPVILLTAHAGRDSVIAGLDSGADDYLSKPFSSMELLARVRAACRLRRAYEQASQANARAPSRNRRVSRRRTAQS